MAGKTKATFCATGLGLLALGGAAFGQTADNDLISEGRMLYEEGAGDVGCAMCHGMAATGDPIAGGTFIRGASLATMESALNGGVPEMNFFDLTNEEKEAIHAYLEYTLRAEEYQLDPIAAAGKVIFEETAGGVGCASCHGDDALGDIGPNIRGTDSVAIFEQLQMNEQMAFIELTDEQVEQVAAYMRHLHDTEDH